MSYNYNTDINYKYTSTVAVDSELSSEIQNTEQEIITFNSERQGYETQGDSFEREKEVEENNFTTIQGEYALAKENTANCQNIYSDAISALNQASARLAEALKTNDPDAIAAAQSNYDTAQNAVTQAKNDLDDAIDYENECEEKINNIQEVIENIVAQINSNNESIDETENNISISEEQLERLFEALKAQQAENEENGINSVEEENNPVNTDELMLSEIEAELQKQIEEVQAAAESKSGLGKLWNGVTGLFGGGTKGETNDLLELQNKLNNLKANGGSSADIMALYSMTFGEEPDINAISESAKSQEELNQAGTITLEDGTQVSQDDIAKELVSQVQSLSDNFDNTVKSQGIFSKIIGKVNNVVGLGTTEKMTKAQLETFQKSAEKLQNAKTPEEFAAAYKSITGEPLSQNSVSQLFEGTSKVENSKAAESMMDYEATNENIKNTATAIGVGIAVAATGPIGALAIGAGATVAVNGIDAITQNNGKSLSEKFVDYAKGDLIKDVLVGGLNGLTGKLGNMAGEKLVRNIATKKIGKEIAGEISEKALKEAFAKGLTHTAQNSAISEALKRTLNVGERVVTEFVDGALDAALSSSGEYLLTAAAGENGNFTNADGNYFDNDGSLALFNNFKENFDVKQMGEQVFFSTLMGGAMSVGMQEGMSLIGGAFGAKAAADGLKTNSNIDFSCAKLSGKNLKELQEAIDAGTLKSCKEALSAGYTIADIVSIDKQIDIFKTGFIDFSDSKEVADIFNSKIAQQMRVKTPEEIDSIVNDIMNSTHCNKTEAQKTLQRLTQFSSFKSQTELAKALSKEDIGFLIDTKTGISTNLALKYLGQSKSQFNLTGHKQGLILDNSALDFLRNANITGQRLKDGIIQIDGHDVKLINVDGWNIGSNGSYIGYSFLGSSLDGNDGLVKTCSDIITGKTSFNDGIHQEAASIIFQKLGIDPNSAKFNIADIKNVSLKNSTSETIAYTMSPNMSNEYIEAFFEKFPEKLKAPNPAEYREVLSKYLYDTMTFISPESTNITMKNMYKEIQSYVTKEIGSYNPDNIIYLAPYSNKSYSLVSQQFANINGIKPSNFMDITQISNVDLTGKTVVLLDDIVGSGDSLNGVISRLNLSNNTHTIFAPLSALNEGIDTINSFMATRNIQGTVISGYTVDASKKFSNNNLLNKILGNSGFSNGYAATFTQYMLPDNNSGLSSLFGRMSVLRPYSIKESSGMELGYDYLKELYGGYKKIVNPSKDSLCGIILKRMDELTAQKT